MAKKKIDAWVWRWGPTLHESSEELTFTDFNEMKRFSTRHSLVTKPFHPEYWSGYDHLEIEEGTL
jgi:hypothetical protein